MARIADIHLTDARGARAGADSVSLMPRPTLPRIRQHLGKYRIEARIGEGGFAFVYRAFDTIEGTRVALKIPDPALLTRDGAEDLAREVRLTARLDHPNICPIRNASIIDGIFVIAYPLGTESLEDRLSRRLSPALAMDFAEQLAAAVAFAHARRLIHCDIKPDNVILFDGGVLKLTDFGIARVTQRTRTASIAGTVGYIAPEQALGKPSARSDVFALGLVMYRMFAGRLPSWPYDWPPPGIERLRRRFSPEILHILRRCIEVNDRKRFRDATKLLAALRAAKATAVKTPRRKRPRRASPKRPDWTSLRHGAFRRHFGTRLGARHDCTKCRGPVTEPMRYCPWCRAERRKHVGLTALPATCPRCRRGQKTDWRFCAWCYGGLRKKIDPIHRPDRRYVSPCGSCGEKLMPFSRYCPWCRAKVRRKWSIDGGSRCRKCGWGVLPDYWEHCPWCAAAMPRKAR